jgi:hypothetical protein
VVAQRVGTDVCSLYILDPRAQRLTLWATVGLTSSSVGKVTMSVEEGLTGMAIEKLEPVMAVDALTHPATSSSPRPARRSTTRSSACRSSTQHADRRARRADAPAPEVLPHEIRLLREIASKVGPIIVTARLMEGPEEQGEGATGLPAPDGRGDQAPPGVRAHDRAAGDHRSRAGPLAAERPPRRARIRARQAHLLQPPVSFDVIEEVRTEHPEEDKRRFKRALKESAAEPSSEASPSACRSSTPRSSRRIA